MSKLKKAKYLRFDGSLCLTQMRPLKVGGGVTCFFAVIAGFLGLLKGFGRDFISGFEGFLRFLRFCTGVVRGPKLSL